PILELESLLNGERFQLGSDFSRIGLLMISGQRSAKLVVKPTAVLQEMVGKLSIAGNGLFTSPPPLSISREKGIYVYLMSKLSKRLSVTLSVDREVLVLFSSFQDQQQRTIRIARELINESEGRLEPTVAIIV